MSASDEKKPSVPSSHVTVSISTQKKEMSVYFRIKKDVELCKMMKAYCDKFGIEMSTLRFHFDGDRIKPNQTPSELGLEDGDEIDAFFDQDGGRSFCYRY
ncbi:hypothetical protein EUTSA_v10015519mg [Eutrema salsugineum]|uniref:Ubiquitin-like domain-containing protein n=1 Tax=Eutrema salsugineum TaxID=72664 RepID=V4LSJ9_EUTSA|nr:hypothetical protein EUTSA_v10015519mg [Eutrema salsugineum]